MGAEQKDHRGIHRGMSMVQITLDDGNLIPQLGLGTFDLKEEHIYRALEMGYRLLDTAWQYGNEAEVGRAVRKSGIKREGLTITTKLWTDDVRTGRVRRALEDSLRNLQMDYVDLYLIHWPAEGFERAWLEMVQLKKEGKIRSIGVSNFKIHHLEALKNVSDEVPVLDQIECHPYFYDTDVIRYCRKDNIAVQAWCPLGGASARFPEKAVFHKIAERYGKTPAQIILRWHLQNGMLVIPRSSDAGRARENLDIFDFELMREDMDTIDALNTGKRIGADPDAFCF